MFFNVSNQLLFSCKVICERNIKQDIIIIKKIILHLYLILEYKLQIICNNYPFKEYHSMAATDKLDKVDLQILRTLQENSRLTTKELAARVSLSSTPVFERLKRLENSGYIKKYIAVLDAEKLNQGFVVFCNVKLRRLNRDIAADFVRIIKDIPEVTECYNISGNFDYLLKINAPNMKYYQEFILNVLGTIDSLGSLESTFVMDEVKHTYGIHI